MKVQALVVFIHLRLRFKYPISFLSYDFASPRPVTRDGQLAFLFYNLLAMEDEIKNYVIMLALDNLIESYTNALEELELTPQEREFAQRLISTARQILDSMYNPQIPKPQWKRT